MDFRNIDFSAPKVRSVSILGHRTSFTLEDNFWFLLKEMAQEAQMPLSKLVHKIDEIRIEAQRNQKKVAGLSVAIRATILEWIKNKNI